MKRNISDMNFIASLFSPLVSFKSSLPARWMGWVCCWKCCELFNSLRTQSPEAARWTHRTWRCATINHISDVHSSMNLRACESDTDIVFNWNGIKFLLSSQTMLKHLLFSVERCCVSLGNDSGRIIAAGLLVNRHWHPSEDFSTSVADHGLR